MNSTSKRTAPLSVLSTPSRLCSRPLLAVLLCSLTMMNSGCGTPVIKVDTSPCNRKEWTARAETLPPLQDRSVRGAVRNHVEVTKQYNALGERHAALAECVEVNSR